MCEGNLHTGVTLYFLIMLDIHLLNNFEYDMSAHSLAHSDGSICAV